MAGLGHVGTPGALSSAVARHVDLLKARGVTEVMTALTHDGQGETSAMAVSSLVDTGVLLYANNRLAELTGRDPRRSARRRRHHDRPPVRPGPAEAVADVRGRTDPPP